ncbi:MAG: hypothetical protein R3F55_25465 [Alphaproteobacteria bacterium]
MTRTTTLAATALLALAATAGAAQAQAGRWSTPQPPIYDPVCGEPENGECYLLPSTGNRSADGRFAIALHCQSTLSVDGATGQNGAQYGTVALAVDGQPLGQFRIVGGLDADYLNPQPTPALIAALRHGGTLTMVFDGVTATTVSLAGSSAAIAALDVVCAGDGGQSTAVQPPATRQRQYFADYMATCRPDGGCDATTFSDTPTSDGNSFSSTLVMNRLGFPGTAWILSFAGAFEGPVPGTPIQVTVGQQSWTLAAGEGYGDIMGHNYFAWPANEQILAAMRTAAFLDVTQTVANGSRQTVRYSLRGLNDAMAWIDQVQGRSGEPALIGVPMALDEIVPGYQPAQ